MKTQVIVVAILYFSGVVISSNQTSSSITISIRIAASICDSLKKLEVKNSLQPPLKTSPPKYDQWCGGLLWAKSSCDSNAVYPHCSKFIRKSCADILPKIDNSIRSSPLRKGESVKWYNEKLHHSPMSLTLAEFRSVVKAPAKDFNAIVDPMIIERVSGTPGNVKVREYIKNEMKKLGWFVDSDSFKDTTPLGVKRFENVIATLNTKVARRLVLACHYDSKYFAKSKFVAATDSAVPCAMLIHLAQVLSKPLRQHKTKAVHNVTLQFIFFDGEEAFVQWTDTDSLYGSRHLAQLWQSTPFPPGNKENTNELHRIDAFMLLDLLGTKSVRIPQYYESTAKWYNMLTETETLLRLSGDLIRSGNLGSWRIFGDKTDGEIADDQIPFVRRNVSAIHIIPHTFPRVWHDSRDDKTALDMDTIKIFNKIFRIFVTRYLHLTNLDQL